MTDLERTGTGVTTARPRKGGRRWPPLLGGLLIGVLKSEAVAKVIFHRGELIALVAVLLASSLLRVRPVGLAFGTALLVALVLGAHSLGFGLALGFGGFALLMALFFAISAVLHARQNGSATRRRRA